VWASPTVADAIDRVLVSTARRTPAAGRGLDRAAPLGGERGATRGVWASHVIGCCRRRLWKPGLGRAARVSPVRVVAIIYRRGCECAHRRRWGEISSPTPRPALVPGAGGLCDPNGEHTAIAVHPSFSPAQSEGRGRSSGVCRFCYLETNSSESWCSFAVSMGPGWAYDRDMITGGGFVMPAYGVRSFDPARVRS